MPTIYGSWVHGTRAAPYLEEAVVALRDDGIGHVGQGAVGVDGGSHKVLVSLGQAAAVNILVADNRFPRRQRMDRWDYMVFTVNAKKLEEALKGAGEEGWELVSIGWEGRICNCVFKRRKQ